MSMLPRSARYFDRMFNDLWRDVAHLERQAFGTPSFMTPYWRFADPTDFGSPKLAEKLINDSNKFSLQLDVSHYKPEQLKVNLDGRKLTIEGDCEEEGEHGFSKRSFSHSLILPEDVDVPQIKSLLSDDGKLCIEAPKAGASKDAKQIPIEKAPPQQTAIGENAGDSGNKA
ncbi:hypothetical protein WR25_11503 [Diploscapter pachys]|uniref:SHSP domain-containing protein n=1 Tax=Diploscapter pachys TaxID=2018661 RepID=A0A2A2L7D3_9BILA|nr:hypothetical protein WR25_11503 [Diploscapter pachys]